MIKHYMTKYQENGSWLVESWLQFNLLKWSFCFSKKQMKLKKPLN